jgi:UDP-N-acetylmuramyl pentapeptide phosphotransferase/UDP-N-acetylglucosamine-1-phosphate transferase
VVIVVLVCLVFALLLVPDINGGALIAYLVGGGLIAIISWLDDIHSLPSKIRFGAHIIGALLALAGCGYWETVNLPLFGSLSLGIVGIPITLLWIVGLTNAYNFMDGIDGIAGGQAVVAGLGWAIIGWLSQQPLLLILGLLLSASNLGFLRHNWPPARIFMGDVGSAFLGYTFAVLPLMSNNPNTPLVGFLLVWPFVLDTSITIARRWLKGENIFTAHRSHFYQRLVIAGYSHASVTLTYIGLAVWGTALAVAWHLKIPWSGVVIVLAILLFTVALWKMVSIKECRSTKGKKEKGDTAVHIQKRKHNSRR